MYSGSLHWRIKHQEKKTGGVGVERYIDDSNLCCFFKINCSSVVASVVYPQLCKISTFFLCRNNLHPTRYIDGENDPTLSRMSRQG